MSSCLIQVRLVETYVWFGDGVVMWDVVAIIVAFFFRENARDFAFHFIEQEDIRGTTSRKEGHTHTHKYTTVLTKRLQLGEEVPSTIDTQRH